MKFSLQASALGALWVQEQNVPTQAATFPFYERLQELLEARQLHGVLAALFDISEELDSPRFVLPIGRPGSPHGAMSDP